MTPENAETPDHSEMPEPVETPTPDPHRQPSVDGRSAWQRLARMGAPRGTRAQLLVAALALVLGFAIVAQVQQTQVSGLESLRQEDLVRLLDDVSQRSTRLDDQARELQAQRDALASGAGTSQQAQAQAEERLRTLRLLAGTATAQGPGIRMTITDPDGKVTAPMLLDTLEELRDAGAEVVQFGSSRVVAQSYFSSVNGQVSVDGQALTRPYVILAIGDKQTLASAMDIPGGIVATMRRQNATATVEQLDTLRVDALLTPRTPRYAQPVPETATPNPS